MAAAVAGHGIVYQPNFLIQEALDAGTLVELELDQPAIELGGIYAAYPADRSPPAKVRATIDFFVEYFASNPPGLRN